jgi:drug/metabolite transporter (DMT)-like permease
MHNPKLQVLLAGALFATGGAAIKLAPGLSPVAIASLRSGIAAIALWFLLPAVRRLPDRNTLLAALPYAATLGLFVIASRLTTAANAVFLQSTAPVWVTLLGPWLLQERVRARDLVTVLLLIGGAVLFFLADDAASAVAKDPALGNLLAAVSGLTWAITVVALRALGRSGAGTPASAATLGNAIACFVGLWFVSFAELADASHVDWLALLWLGVAQIAIAYALLGAAMQRLSALDATLLLMIEPTLSPVFTFLVHGERPAALAILGGAVILIVLAARAYFDRRRTIVATGG